MASDALQSFLVIVALVGAMLFVRSITRTKARTRPAPAAQPPRVLPAPGAAGLLPVPPPVFGVLETLAAAVPQTSERRRLSLVEARNGIVLATILGACRAQRAEERW